MWLLMVCTFLSSALVSLGFEPFDDSLDPAATFTFVYLETFQAAGRVCAVQIFVKVSGKPLSFGIFRSEGSSDDCSDYTLVQTTDQITVEQTGAQEVSINFNSTMV